MSQPPFISIMMPCYNANGTLPRALASVLCQTYAGWECIIVDDGSDERPEGIVFAASDPRIRLIRHEENRGRAIARQTALDAARGDYLAMLDADDWMYPTRLEDQLRVLLADEGLSLVSSEVAIVNGENDIIGVRGGSACHQCVVHMTQKGLRWPPFVHAPSMIRTSIARQYTYEPRLTVSEDVQFVLNIILDRRYALIPDIHYAYAEGTTLTAGKMSTSLRHSRYIMRSYLHQYPASATRLIAESYVKSLAYGLAFRLGMEQRLVSRRSRQPSAEEIVQFKEARRQVDTACQRVFGQSRTSLVPDERE